MQIHPLPHPPTKKIKNKTKNQNKTNTNTHHTHTPPPHHRKYMPDAILAGDTPTQTHTPPLTPTMLVTT